MEVYDKSLEYLDKGLRFKTTQNDIYLKSLFKEFKGDNYNNLGFLNQELQEYDEILQILPNNGMRKYEQIFSRINARMAHNYYNQKDLKSASKHIDIALKVQERLSLTEKTPELYNVYLVKGEISLALEKTDSAYYYFKKASNLIRKGIEYEFISHKSFGDYYRKIGEHEKAISFFLKALEDMDNFNVNDLKHKSDITKSLAELYQLLEDEEMYLKYINLHIKTDLKHRENEKKDLQTAVDIILKNKSYEKKYRALWFWTIVFVFSFLLLLLLLLLLLFILCRKSKIKKRVLLRENENASRENEQNIKILEQKLKVSVDELIDDAKNDRDSFLEKFQTVYPEFYNNLLSRYPNLNSGELKLLAYIYLNFSTKEIATHTFRSYRTIQSRKYLLRKKLGLESHEDFYIWLRNIGNSSLSL